MKLMYWRILFFAQIVCFISCKQNKKFEMVSYTIEPKLERINTVLFELEGRQEMFQNIITQNWLLGLADRNPYMLDMFELNNKSKNDNLLPWSGEFAGKYLTGAVGIYRLHRIPKLKQEMDNLVNRLCILQTPSGYLGPWPKQFELTGRMPGGNVTWDAWNHYHLMIGLLEYYRFFGDDQSIKICRNIGDRLCAEFLNQPDKLIQTEKAGGGNGNMEFNLTLAHSLCLLYRAVSEPNYLDLAKQIIHQGFSRYGDYMNRALNGKDFFETEWEGGSRWERLHAIMALAELYWLTGEDNYRKAFEQIWWSIIKSDIHNTGAFSTNEKAIGNPYEDGSIETCCTIAWQALSVEMLKLTANSVVADMLELTHLNATYASWDISGSWNTYHTGTYGKRRPSTVDIAFQIRPGTEELNCCSANAPRSFGILSDWALMKDGTGYTLNWYGEGKISVNDGNNGSVMFTQTTDYPNNGNVLIHVNTQRQVSFSLKLRIPFWSLSTKVKINDKEIAFVKSGSYLQLDRKWSPGDKINLELDMQPHFWPGENQYSGFGSIYHGPILLAWKRPAEPVIKSESDWDIKAQSITSFSSNKVGSKLVGEFRGERLYIIYDQHLDGGHTRLLIDGEDHGIIDHFAPKLIPLKEWQSPLLKPDKHKFIIEIVSNKNSKSKGNWARLREIRFHSLPIFDARTLQLTVASFNPKGVPWLSFAAMDVEGQKIELEDFDSAGKNNDYYYTWVPLKGLSQVNCSCLNPPHSVRP